MIPILFPYDTSPAGPFDYGSLGRLGDALSCKVTEAGGGHSYQYTLEMAYPVTGRHLGDLIAYNIILATPSKGTKPQPFRIKKVTRPIDGIITVYAEHISYDLDGFPLYIQNDVTGAANAMAAASQFRGVSSPFYLYTNIPDTSKVVAAPTGPVTAREFLLMTGGVQDTFGGEWLFDCNQVGLLKTRGVDSGLVLRRGKNISGIKQDETVDESFSGIFPFWKGGDTVVTLPEYVLGAPGKYIDSIAIVDFSREFKKKPTVAKLRAKANAYLEAKIRPQPTLSTSVDFVLLSQTLEYKDLASVESLHLYDSVHVIYDSLGVDVNTKVCKTVYDVLLDRYESVDIGAVKQSVYRAVKKIAEKTTQASGGSVRQAASDEVVDTGTSGSWSYRHWASGKKEAWFRSSVRTGSTWTASGNVYRASWSTTIPSAVGFESAPNTLITLGASAQNVFTVNGGATSKTAISGYAFRGQSSSSSSTLTISIYAWTD